MIISLLDNVRIVEGTINILSEETREIVFSVEEAGVDTTSGFELEVVLQIHLY
jgi:hypothetical protein